MKKLHLAETSKEFFESLNQHNGLEISFQEEPESSAVNGFLFLTDNKWLLKIDNNYKKYFSITTLEFIYNIKVFIKLEEINIGIAKLNNFYEKNNYTILEITPLKNNNLYTDLEMLIDQLNVPQFKPNEVKKSRRKAKRIDVRKGDGISAELILDKNNKIINSQVYDLSTAGLAVIVEKDQKGIDLIIGKTGKGKVKLTKSEIHNVKFSISSIKEIGNNKLKIGIKFLYDEINKEELHNEISKIHLPNDRSIQGVMYKKHFY